MSTWAHSYRSSQLYDTHDLEILNNTLRTFASPEPDPDSHTAAKTKHLRKLRDDLPSLRINTNFASPSLTRSRNTRQQRKGLQSDQLEQAHNKTLKVPDSRKYDSEITRPGVHAVKFDIDPTTHHRHKNDKDYVTSNLDHEGLRIKNQNQLRRASAPSHGMAFAYFSAPATTSIYYFGQGSSESSQDARNRSHFVIPSVNVEHHDHDHSDDVNDHSNVTATSSVTSTPGTSNLPSLSPCSSASSISSSVDTLNSAAQQQSLAGKVQFSFGTFLPQPVHAPCPIRSKSISTEIPFTSQAHSLPDMVTGASYDHVPWSPAKDFLANLAQATMAKPMPDEEGQQVGEYVIGKVIGRGGFSTVKEAIRMDDYSGLEKVAVKIVKNDQDSDCNDHIQSLLQREIVIWKKLIHPNVVSMLSVTEDDYATYVFSEYCP
ncbi:13438_t:CDS:2, partial [Acaulospora colombiana]